MIDNWWQFGEGIGFLGSELALFRIECAFCGSKGNFSLSHREEMKKPNGDKILYFDTYKCANCAGYIMVFWTNNGEDHHGLHAYRTVPIALHGIDDPPEYWPDKVKKHWTQAHKSMTTESWDAAVVMARSTLHAAVQNKGGVGRDLFTQVEDLANKGLLPPLMKEWATEIRLLGKVSAHPEEEEKEVVDIDARDIIQFMDYFLEYVYDFPKQIHEYRERRSKKS